ncbi:MAG: hypothetical protein WAO74_01585 [Polaribacter sp.]|uniref:hypothetical protein n=1 Tax=Polaribacter sp. TaxID=1920175 RepID=UPI003BAE4FE2
MKNIILLLTLLTSTFIYAQRGGGGMGGGRPQQNQNRQQGTEREVKEFNASDVAGIFYYDVAEVIKKIKVKDDEIKASTSKALKEYNFKIKEISFLNSDKFKDVDVLMKSSRANRGFRQRSSNNNTDQQPKEVDSLRIKVNKIIRPISRDVNNNEEILNESLKSILSEKQFKKWLKYQENIKEELAPKKPERNNNNRGQQQGQRGNGQQTRGFE